MDGRQKGTVKRLLAGDKISQKTIDGIVGRYEKRLLDHRHTTIARTEMLRTPSMAEHESLVQADQKGELNSKLTKYWIHFADERVRATHVSIPAMNPDGRPAPHGVFITSLGPLRYPRDPAGIPQNVINCRCTLRYDLGKREPVLDIGDL